MVVRVHFKKLNDEAVIPEYSTQGASGMDIRSIEDKSIDPGKVAIVSTGLSCEMITDPSDNIYISGFPEIQVRSRSGLAAKHGVIVANSPGTIDSDYRGEIKIILLNTSDIPFKVNKGDRIAQLVVNLLPKVEVSCNNELSDTDRGEGGLGSTGVK